MFQNIIYELTLILDNKKFQEIWSRTNLISIQEDEYVDDCLEKEGVLILYRNSPYKKKIRVAINAGMLSDFEDISSDELLRKINRVLGKYFNGQYLLNDFDLAKTILMRDIDVQSKKRMLGYLHVLDRTNREKSFIREKDAGLDKKSYFCLQGKCNGIGFMIYNLEDRLKKEDFQKNASKQLNGIFRTEISFLKTKALKTYVKGSSTSDYIREVNKKSEKIFLETFTKIVPFGDFYKKDEAIDRIQKQVKDKVLRRKMIRLVTLIPEKKSLLLAQKAMYCRDMEKVMSEFVKINLSPVTISKRQELKHLKNIYAFIL